ncbi:MAG: DnaB-like helicase C-terminal domain-containing protein, partial [Bartonella sp.]|nr:DnaB-like helicase C-terminal domain-containing protein [Bartonella sp.]
IFVYREEYYLKNEEPKIGSPEHLRWQASMDEVFGKADIIVAKQRHGPTGIVKLSFQADFTRFSDLADSNYLPEQYG